jgi:thymidylate synthase (FAD)
MNDLVNLLDHGYVRVIETWGSDQRIVEAARMSTQKGFLGWGTPEAPGDEKLLKYLYENNHATPFEFAGMIIEVQTPIMVTREWQRHRTQGYNEMSARYGPLPDMNYVPTVERIMLNAREAGSNKQAGTIAGAAELTEEQAAAYRVALIEAYGMDQELYEWALRTGVPKELARLHLPVGRYTKFRATTCLRNWLGFLTLRMDKKAQWEIRQYANAVGTFIAHAFPRTWELFKLEAA